MQEQLQSLVKDERKCVTIQHVAWHTTGGNRTAAAEHLRALDGVQHYVVTPTKENDRPDGVSCTVFKLSRGSESSSLSPSDSLYAIRDPACTEALDGAHERDMAGIRDCLQLGGRGVPSPIQPPTLIRPASEIQEEPEDPATMDVEMTETTSTMTHSTDALQQRSKTQKKTTAANFFNSRARTKKEEGKENQTTTTASKEKVEKKPAPTKKTSKPAPKKAVAAQPETKKEGDVGLVDDMIGDEESDEEETMKVAKKKSRTEAASTAAEPMDVDSDNEEDDAPVVAAPKARKKKAAPVRATGVVKTTGAAPQHRRRRLVKKKETYADDKGYIHMKVVDVWEDIPSDEEDAKPKAATKPKPKPAKKAKSALKQGSLSGFFKKK